jgi:FAD synthetase
MKKVIVFGSFDPLHEGHRHFFRQAKKLGDRLTVVVARNKCLRHDKNHPPRFDESIRIETIEKEALVDSVKLGDRLGEYQILEKEKPDIIGVGYDQKIPLALKNNLKKYKIIRLKPYRPDIYKSSLTVDKD